MKGKEMNSKSQLNYFTLDDVIRKNLQKLITELEIADKMKRKGKNKKAYQKNMETAMWFQKIFGDLMGHAVFRLSAMVTKNEILFLSKNQKRLINNLVFTCTRTGKYVNHLGQVWTSNSPDLVTTAIAIKGN